MGTDQRLLTLWLGSLYCPGSITLQFPFLSKSGLLDNNALKLADFERYRLIPPANFSKEQVSILIVTEGWL